MILTAFVSALLLAVPQQEPDVSVVTPTHHRRKVRKAVAKPRPKVVFVQSLAPATIVYNRMHFADKDADYIYRFQNDGQYEATILQKGSLMASEKTGKYLYKKLIGNGAILSLDEVDWNLVFDLPNRAKAVSTKDPRTQWFYLEVLPEQQ